MIQIITKRVLEFKAHTEGVFQLVKVIIQVYLNFTIIVVALMLPM